MIDNMPFQIDSPDYAMCGQWMMDLIKMWPPTPATQYRLDVYPFFMPDPRSTAVAPLPEVADWNCDSRYMDTLLLTGPESAADAARKLSDLLFEHGKKLSKREKG